MKASLLIASILTTTSMFGCASEPAAPLSTAHPAHADASQGASQPAPHHDHTAHAPAPAADPHAGHAAHADHATHTAPAAATGPVIPNPLSVCLVSGEDLGSMGKPYQLVHDGRQIVLCCKACEKEFKENAAKYVQKFDDAVKAAKLAK